MDKTQIYLRCINAVIDYIESHLDRAVTLDELADLSGFSKYHFHRIFQSFTNEALYRFVIRLRVERAAALLVSRNDSVTDIAFACGFNDSATFSRAFKKHFGVSAVRWRRERKSKIRQEVAPASSYRIESTAMENDVVRPSSVSEERRPERTVAYVRYTGPFAGDGELFQRLNAELMRRAEGAGLVRYPETEHIIVYHDPLGITDDERLRVSVGITVPRGASVATGLGTLTLAEGMYTECTFRVTEEQYGAAWNYVYRTALPTRGLAPGDGNCLERYTYDCYHEEDGTTTVALCVPTIRL
ncbi:MAG: AraC family transcriptional regulator [Spirochaetales bacterium]|nr:AraC family transcriptional regulator [Spirochaetales bacterium]